jgi:cbb3-type cytochrome oxidase cytochrome c subunit
MPPYPWIVANAAEQDALIAYIQSLGRVKDWRPARDYEQ